MIWSYSYYKIILKNSVIIEKQYFQLVFSGITTFKSFLDYFHWIALYIISVKKSFAKCYFVHFFLNEDSKEKKRRINFVYTSMRCISVSWKAIVVLEIGINLVYCEIERMWRVCIRAECLSAKYNYKIIGEEEERLFLLTCLFAKNRADSSLLPRIIKLYR